MRRRVREGEIMGKIAMMKKMAIGMEKGIVRERESV